MRFVLDNSVVMRWLFSDGSEADQLAAQRVLEQLTIQENSAIAPAIWPLELANVVARAESKGLLGEAHSSAFIGLLQRMAIRVVEDTASHALGNILHLARRYQLSSYDAAYLELAMREGLALATLDKQLARAAKKAGVVLLPEAGG